MCMACGCSDLSSLAGCAYLPQDAALSLPVQDLERKHASDRESWRKDTAEAVREAREEMAALTDQRLDATTKQTICTNEAMAGGLHGAGRQRGSGRLQSPDDSGAATVKAFHKPPRQWWKGGQLA